MYSKIFFNKIKEDEIKEKTFKTTIKNYLIFFIFNNVKEKKDLPPVLDNVGQIRNLVNKIITYCTERKSLIKLNLENIIYIVKKVDGIIFEQIKEAKKIYPKKYIFSESISVYCLCPLSNGKIAFSGRDETIKIVDTNLKQINTILTNNKGPALSLAEYSENIIISGGADSYVKLYDIKNKKCVCLDIYMGHRGQVNCVIKTKFNKDRNMFISAGADGIIRVLSYNYEKENKNNKINNDISEIINIKKI